MQIRTATTADQPAWDAYVQGHPDGLAYQLFAWLLAVQRAYGYEQHSALAEKNGSICGLLPLVDFKRPLCGSNLISLPYCDAGGVLTDSPAIAAKLLEFASEQAARTSSGLELRSTCALPVTAVNQTDKVRMLLDLPDSSEALLAGLKAKLRSQVKRPVKDGLTVKFAGVELIDHFYQIFSENMRDLGSPVHSRGWIKSIVDHYQQRAKLAVVYTPKGEPAAAGIILLHPTTVSIPWASALRKYNSLNPNMLLYWTFLAYAADNGYQYFDFGRSTPGEGTYRFKEQWGAKPSPLFWYELSAATDSADKKSAGEKPAGSTMKRQLVGNLWRKLPVFAANRLGPLVRRYISL